MSKEENQEWLKFVYRAENDKVLFEYMTVGNKTGVHMTVNAIVNTSDCNLDMVLRCERCQQKIDSDDNENISFGCSNPSNGHLSFHISHTNCP